MKTPQLILVLPLAGLVFAGAAIQAPGQSAPTLTVTNNLQLWLEADAGVTTNAAGAVTAWGDQSGQGYVATQVDESLAPSWAPNAIKGYPVVHFDGATRYLDIFDAPGLAITGNITIFCVLKCDDFNLWRAIWAQTPAGNAAPNEYRIERSSGLPFFIRGSSAAIGTVSATQPMVAGEYAVIAVEANGEEIAHYLNGATNGTGTISIPPEDEGVPPRIGSRNDLVTQMKGDIAELLVYNTALEETERKQVFE
ncbi:MAG: LamG domain-containing protein, partial [Candidatus Omnitrophica bacterium]|nr:LamG domain-containing protein [Candidatus Omnitrophota bacterium]